MSSKSSRITFDRAVWLGAIAILLSTVFFAASAAAQPSRSARATREALARALAASDSAAAASARLAEASRQSGPASLSAGPDVNAVGSTTSPALTFESRADSLAWARAKSTADKSTGFRLIVSLRERHVWAIVGKDTVLSAPAAVAMGTTLTVDGKSWTFKTPPGVRTVLSKESNPVWVPPDWLYAETAKEHGLALGRLKLNTPKRISDGRMLVVRDSLVGLLDEDGEFGALPVDEHIVFDDTLFVPPIGTINRRVEGALGKYRLNLGEGYLLHGTPYQNSIGLAATHGCVRLRDEDIEWLYENVKVGTRVYIY